MDSSLEGEYPVVEQQIAMLEALGKSLARASQSLLSMDLAGLEMQTATQNQICRDLSARGFPATSGAQALQAGSGELNRRLQRALQQVRHLALVHALLLRRAQHSAQVLENLLTNASPIYAAPHHRPAKPLEVGI